MLVNQILSVARERLAVIGEEALLTDAAKLLRDTHIALVVVCDARGAMTGVVSKSDIVRRIGMCQDNPCSAGVASAMTRAVVSCRPHDTLHEVLALMKERGLVHLPVVDEKSRPLGVVNARDALNVLLKAVEHEETLLRDYVMGIGYR